MLNSAIITQLIITSNSTRGLVFGRLYSIQPSAPSVVIPNQITPISVSTLSITIVKIHEVSRNTQPWNHISPFRVRWHLTTKSKSQWTSILDTLLLNPIHWCWLWALFWSNNTLNWIPWIYIIDIQLIKLRTQQNDVFKYRCNWWQMERLW